MHRARGGAAGPHFLEAESHRISQYKTGRGAGGRKGAAGLCRRRGGRSRASSWSWPVVLSGRVLLKDLADGYVKDVVQEFPLGRLVAPVVRKSPEG